MCADCNNELRDEGDGVTVHQACVSTRQCKLG